MKKGQVQEAVVDRVDFPCKGVAQVQGEAVIVKNVLPGQKIRFCVSKARSGKAEGRLLEVLEKSPLETDSPCSHFGLCGGCSYLSLPYGEQLRVKEGQVKRLLDACLGRQAAPWRWEGIKDSPMPYAYRNKMEFSFGDERKDGPLALGMHRRGGVYDVVTVDGCQIVDADYRLILRTALDYFGGRGVSYCHRLRHEGYLRHLVVRKAARTGEILAALVTTSQCPWKAPEEEGGCSTEGQLLAGFLESLLALERGGVLAGRFAGILHIVNDSQADVVQSDCMHVLYGRDFFYEELLGLRFKVSIFSFFQTNTYGAEVLYETAREYIGTGSGSGDGAHGRVVYDLYSGTGTIAQLMAAAADRVVGVEIVEEAVEAARKNAEANGLGNCEFIAGDVLKVLDTLEERPDVIVLDPPREGVHPKALPKVIAYGAERVIYISCKPTSLVRDLEGFLAAGYVVERAAAVDQFPWTGNIETVVKLSLKTDTPKIEVTMEPDTESNFTPAEKGTYQNIKAYIREKYGLKVHTLYIAQIKDKCGLDKERSGNGRARGEGAKVPKCPLEKEAAILDAFRHFGMI